MNQFRKLLVVIAAMTASLVTLMPSAASAYPACLTTTISVVPSADSMVGGGDLTIDVVAESDDQLPAGTLTVTAFGKTSTAANGAFSKTVTTPVVSAKKVFAIKAQFTPDSPCTGTSVAAVAEDPTFKASSGTENVTLLPEATQDTGLAGVLPNTGGASIWFIVLGVALLGFGAAVVGRSRRTKKFL